jgi:UDP-N-acetylmuramyl pentapeptide phosphotransferase/UDP-N-acetylglucosamine-1-phosphate transferase
MIRYAGLSTFDDLLWLAAIFALSAVLTWAALRYALRRNLVDVPGQRRSHSVPTPRGGGIGLCIASIVGLIATGLFLDGISLQLRLSIALALVAVVGWIDDHRPLPILARLIPQFIAAMLFFWPIIDAVWVQRVDRGGALFVAYSYEWLSIGIVLCVWSINLHNFMDGIDGLLGAQAIFVFAVLAWLCTREEGNAHGLQIGLWAAAVAAFLPFNFPRARIFMGDVGSGTLGLMIFIAAAWQYSGFRSAHISAVIVGSAFLTDATCTLLSRMVRRKKWYRPHREHLYQSMARTGMSHAKVVAWYSAWNIVIVLPIIYVLNGEWVTLVPSIQWIVAAGLYAVAVVVWICGKRWCLYKVKKAALAHA